MLLLCSKVRGDPLAKLKSMLAYAGGLSTAMELGPLFTLIKTHPQKLRFSGLMGYDVHVVKGAHLFSVKSALMRSTKCLSMRPDGSCRKPFCNS